MAVDEAKLNDFLGQFITDLGATANAAMVVIGHRLGLYRALADAPPLTASELSERTGTTIRYVTEWLSAQAASGYVTMAGASRFTLSPEQAFALSDPGGPLYLPGAFVLALASLKAEPRISQAFRTGAGLAWHEQDSEPVTRDGVLVSPAWLEARLHDPAVRVEYQGERFWPSGGMEPGGRAGHVPSAVHQPIGDLYDDRGSFRPAADLRGAFPAADLGGDSELITYCTIGGRASTAWFVLTYLLGRDHVRVYDGSWAEWGRMDDAPVECP